MLKRTGIALLTMLLAVGCTKGPGGLLGVTWNTPAEVAIRHLSVPCEAWTPWPDLPSFEYCNSGRLVVFEQVADVTVTRHRGKLAGFSLWFDDCDVHALRRNMIRTLPLDPRFQGTETWSNGERVRLRRFPRHFACQVRVMSGAYGNAWSELPTSTPAPYTWN